MCPATGLEKPKAVSRTQLTTTNRRRRGKSNCRWAARIVDVDHPFDAIKDGELWISHKHRTINLRCPCGCGELTVLSLHPSRWHLCFDGKSVTLKAPTGGSIWTTSDCGSHYLILNNEVVWSYPIDPCQHADYEDAERARMVRSLEPDEQGMIGRQCPQAECGLYFKVRLGTG